MQQKNKHLDDLKHAWHNGMKRSASHHERLDMLFARNEQPHKKLEQFEISITNAAHPGKRVVQHVLSSQCPRNIQKVHVYYLYFIDENKGKSTVLTWLVATRKI